MIFGKSRIRRIKCDLARPSCLKCHNTGRTCDGYGNVGVVVESNASLPIQSLDNTVSRLKLSIVRRRHLADFGTKTLRPFNILPATGSAQLDALSFFQNVSIPHLSKYRPCDQSWHNTLMYFSQTIPSVRHATIAVALLHRSHLDGNSTYAANHRSSVQETALFHNTRAMQLLLHQSPTDENSDQMAIVLLVCYLFICFDHLAGTDVQALQHLEAGVKLSCNLMKTLESDRQANGQSGLSAIDTFIRQVANRIRRLDMQTTMFLTDRTPISVQVTSNTHLIASNDAFWSVDQATDSLLPLIARVMQIFYASHECPRGDIVSFSPQATATLAEVESWLIRFEAMMELQQSGSLLLSAGSGDYPIAALLRLQSTVGTILLKCLGPDREMNYDLFLPQFEECVALARIVMEAHEQYSGQDHPTFTPEVGVLPVLYIIGAKCRHPQIRREIVKILKRQLIREAVWNSIWTAAVLERIIDIEEKILDTERSLVQEMDQITALQRIEAVSWVHVSDAHSTDRLDVTYIFCDQSRVHEESLFV